MKFERKINIGITIAITDYGESLFTNGIKQNVTKLDKFKKTAVPLFCPSCKQIMDKQLDPYYFKSYGTCLD